MTDTELDEILPSTQRTPVRYSLEFDVGDRHIRLANYACKTIEEAETEIAEWFSLARSIRAQQATP